MNQKGESLLFMMMGLLVISGILTLSALKTRYSFSLLKKRSELFLCVKETKGELNNFLYFMGQSNWAIKNIHRASLFMMVIPGLQGTASNAQKLKKSLMALQNFKLVSYLKTMHSLKTKGCFLDPKLAITPFTLTPFGIFARNHEDQAILRNQKWNYYFIKSPYLIELMVDATHSEQIKPSLIYQAREREVKFFSLLSHSSY